MLISACAGWGKGLISRDFPGDLSGSHQHRSLLLFPWHPVVLKCTGAFPASVLALPAALSQESDQRLSGTRVTSRRVEVPLNWQVPETPVVGLMDRFGFLEWPAQPWLGRCGIKHLIPVQLCVFVVSLALHRWLGPAVLGSNSSADEEGLDMLEIWVPACLSCLGKHQG